MIIIVLSFTFLNLQAVNVASRMSDNLKDKSELNLDAAKILLENRLYDSICHPAYYACLQLMSYKLIRKGTSLKEQSSEISQRYYGHSHKYLINKTSSIIKFNNYRDKLLYEGAIKKLKAKREDSDYHDVRIAPNEGEKCIELAEQVITYLKTIV